MSEFNVADLQAIQSIDYNQVQKRLGGFTVISGCDVTVNTGTPGSGNSALSVASGEVLHNGSILTVGATSVDIAAAGSLPRKDLVIHNGTDVAVITGDTEEAVPSGATGTDARRPAPASLDGMEVVPLAEVWVGANITTIASADITPRQSGAQVQFPSAKVASTPTESDDVARLADVGGGGGSSGVTTTQTTNYTASSGDIVLADTSAGSFTVTLPSPTTSLNVSVKKIDTSANGVTIATPSAQTIDGMGSLTITGEYIARTVVSDGTDYFLL